MLQSKISRDGGRSLNGLDLPSDQDVPLSSPNLHRQHINAPYMCEQSYSFYFLTSAAPKSRIGSLSYILLHSYSGTSVERGGIPFFPHWRGLHISSKNSPAGSSFSTDVVTDEIFSSLSSPNFKSWQVGLRFSFKTQ